MAEPGSVFGEPILWRDTMKSPRLMIFDARAIVFVALLVFHLRLWTALLLVAGIMVFWLIERAGLRFPSALRALRSRIAGPQRPARAGHLYRTTIDYGFEGHPLIKPSRPQQRAFEARQAATAIAVTSDVTAAATLRESAKKSKRRRIGGGCEPRPGSTTLPAE